MGCSAGLGARTPVRSSSVKVGRLTVATWQQLDAVIGSYPQMRPANRAGGSGWGLRAMRDLRARAFLKRSLTNKTCSWLEQAFSEGPRAFRERSKVLGDLMNSAQSSFSSIPATSSLLSCTDEMFVSNFRRDSDLFFFYMRMLFKWT